MQNPPKTHLLLAVMLLISAPLGAQETAPAGASERSDSLREAAQLAVSKNPEVLARWHAYREANNEVDAAKGGFLPRVDVSAARAHERTVQKQAGTDLSYSGNESSLTLRQMVFDGFATSSEVRRLGKAKMVRYFELLDASENAALEAARAYLDVVRYRAQVVLAEDNYLQHQAALDQLKKRAESGVGKRVDVDQAASRLALADVNLTTAYANLHDVMARYLRVVGEQPTPSRMAAPDTLSAALPASSEAALADAVKHNPALCASVENVESAQYALEGSRAAFMPRVDLVARHDGYSNYVDEGKRTDNRVELRLNYNLFNGGTDLARNRQSRERKDQALDLREKACRDMRQTLSIAFNDTLRLSDQRAYITEQVRLVEKTRAAYRDQFNIGQRTLLDLLNTQNEYFDARRTQINADVDRTIAYLRSYAAMGRLLEVLELKRIDADEAPGEDSMTAVDIAQLCPPTVPLEASLDRQALAQKIKEMRESAAPALVGANNASAPAAAAGDHAQDAGLADELSARTKAWAEAWTARDVKAYLAFYAVDFAPEGGVGREAWARQREQRLTKADNVRLEMQNLTVRRNGPDAVTVTFRQVYSSTGYRDTSDKTLEWRRDNGHWLIVREAAATPAR